MTTRHVLRSFFFLSFFYYFSLLFSLFNMCVIIACFKDKLRCMKDSLLQQIHKEGLLVLLSFSFFLFNRSQSFIKLLNIDNFTFKKLSARKSFKKYKFITPSTVQGFFLLLFFTRLMRIQTFIFLNDLNMSVECFSIVSKLNTQMHTVKEMFRAKSQLRTEPLQ